VQAAVLRLPAALARPGLPQARLNLTDELGVGARGVFHAVRVLARSARQRRRAVAEGGTEQLPLAAAMGGSR